MSVQPGAKVNVCFTGFQRLPHSFRPGRTTLAIDDSAAIVVVDPIAIDLYATQPGSVVLFLWEQFKTMCSVGVSALHVEM